MKQAAPTSQAAAPAEVPPATPAQPTVESQEAKFGYRGALARAELERQKAEGGGADRLEATVVEVTSRPHGELVLTLDNGQVWAQKAASSIRIKAGDQVVIRKASLGSFLLVAPNKRSTRVIREK